MSEIQRLLLKDKLFLEKALTVLKYIHFKIFLLYSVEWDVVELTKIATPQVLANATSHEGVI